jgi:pyruvate dehydrogenase E1 component alpha subunit/2-oxoisovalerate dehydrogenase E1 component alpha subunit
VNVAVRDPAKAHAADNNEPRQILREDGSCDEAAVPAGLTPARVLELYTHMLRIRVMDARLMGLQRQGRISFYGEARGQEAAVVGSAANLNEGDWLVPALREAGAGLVHGLPLQKYVAQVFGTANDLAKGRQMPCHPGTRASKYLTMSSCIATQLPHAVGIAMGMRVTEKDKPTAERHVVLGYLGDGATSEGDFHVAMNFAAVYHAPVVIFCQNNQWAISTSVEKQTVSATIAVKAVAYGMPYARVDGNDLFAVYAATDEAVERARSGGGPTFIEALNYRLGAHTSSDDPSRYRDESVTEKWKQKEPLVRLRAWLEKKGVHDAAADEALRARLDAEIKEAVAVESDAPPPPIESLIEDVYAVPPWHLREQLAQLLRDTGRA